MTEQSKTYTASQLSYLEKNSSFLVLQDHLLDKVFALRTATEKDVYLYILRRNLAGKFPSTKITYGEFERVLDRNRSGIIEAVKALREKKYIRVQTLNKYHNYYSCILAEKTSGAEPTSIAEHTSIAKATTGMAQHTSSVGPAIPECTGLLNRTSMASSTHLLEELKILNTTEFQSELPSIKKLLIQNLGERQKLSPEHVQELIREYVRVEV